MSLLSVIAALPWTRIGAVMGVLSGSSVLAWYKYFRHERRQLLAGEAPRRLRRQPGVELLPFRWEVNVASDIPDVAVVVWAINYLDKPARIKSARVPYFAISGIPPIDPIVDTDEVELQPRSCRQILLRRSLTDSEARAIRERAAARVCEAEVRLATRWESKKNSGDFNPGANYVAWGLIRGLSEPRELKSQ